MNAAATERSARAALFGFQDGSRFVGLEGFRIDRARPERGAREADVLAGPEGRIAFAPVPEVGLGRAVNDRLRRAAAPRA